MKSTVIILAFNLFSNFLFGQISINFSDFEKDDYVGITNEYALFRTSPSSESEIIDTVKNNWSDAFIFKILDENAVGGFVNVQYIIANESGETLDAEKQVFSIVGGAVKDGPVGWVSKEELQFYSVPDRLTLYTYSDDNEILNCIIKHAEWQSYNNPKNYNEYHKPTHAECYYKIATNFYEIDSLQKAIFYLTKSIQILPRKTSYIVRALAKAGVEDYQGAISDCTKGINLENTSSYKINESKYLLFYSNIDLKFGSIDLFYIRGRSYYFIKNYNSAIVDFNTVIKNNNEHAPAYLMRAYSKFNLNQKNSACLDLSKAGELGMTEVYDEIKKYCN
jgi:tetratricopeptide (TPR) repeat protein